MPKPLFERDFFDMTEEASLPTLPLPTPIIVLAADSPAEEATILNLEAGTTSQQPLVNSNLEAKKEAPLAVIQGRHGKKSKASTPGNTSQPAIPPLPVLTTSVGDSARRRNVRQTFVLEESYLERIRDYVHARRSQGDYRYSQKQLLEEALDLLLASQSPAPPRPTELREQEQQLRVRIQQGRHDNADPKHGVKQQRTAPRADDAK